jgi:hypothetical protein
VAALLLKHGARYSRSYANNQGLGLVNVASGSLQKMLAMFLLVANQPSVSWIMCSLIA